MEKILVPSDFSSFAQNALKVACQIARKTEGELIVLHVIPPLNSALLAADASQIETTLEEKYINQLRKQAEKQIEKSLNHEEFPLEKAKIVIERGNFLPIFLHTAEKSGVDLIIMGTHGTNPLEDIFVGSNTEKVVRKAHCPVLAVKDAPANFMLAKILFPTNFDSDHLKPLAKVREFQRMFDAHLHLLYVNSYAGFLSNEEIIDRKNEFVKLAHLDDFTFHITHAKTEEAGIMAAAKELEVDLIVILTHQRKGLSKFLLGSIAEGVVNHAPSPVMTIALS
jgi:nucleotide-binding universal stress UspA family protein